MSYLNETKVLKSCDYITLDVRTTDAWKNTTGTDFIPMMEWFIPNGAYKSVIETPHITTVEYVSGGYRGSANDIGIVVRYGDNAVNQYVEPSIFVEGLNNETNKYPVLAYGNLRASNSPVFISNGELIVNDRPNFIRILMTQVSGTGVKKDNLLGFTFTLKFSYYESKKV